MIISPDGKGSLDVRRVAGYEVRTEDLVNQIGATRSRGQKTDGANWVERQIPISPTFTGSPAAEEPGHITIQADVDNVRKSATKQVIERLYVAEEEAKSIAKSVKHLYIIKIY